MHAGLRKLMIDDKFMRKKVSKSMQAIEVNEIVFSASFWQDARNIAKVLAPILKILRLADREGATMGLMYELTDRMVERVEKMQGIDERILEEVKDLCVERWDLLHTPLHAGLYLASRVERERAR